MTGSPRRSVCRRLRRIDPPELPRTPQQGRAYARLAPVCKRADRIATGGDGGMCCHGRSRSRACACRASVFERCWLLHDAEEHGDDGGSVGDSYGPKATPAGRYNALAESVIGLFKTELSRRRPWRSLEAVEFATLEWVDWFNHRRLLGPIGNVPPAEAEARFYTHPQATAMAA